VKYSLLLRLLRNGCGITELALWFRTTEFHMRGHVRHVERRVRRQLRHDVRLAA
jgi:hypothetical protein